jgi:signal transduction histidine kinase
MVSLVDLTFTTVRSSATARAVGLERTGAASAHVTGDPQRLAQVVAVLLDNAAAVAPPGTNVAVDVERTEGRVCLRVSDVGPGMPEMIRLSLFAPARAEDVLSHWQGGLGLSLFAARRIAEVHGGRLELETPVHGASVLLILPSAS